jgi:hypothetical protein
MKQECEQHYSRLETKVAAVEAALNVQRKPYLKDRKAPLLRKGETSEQIKKPLASLLGLV